MKLTEQQLRNIIAESVDTILNESFYDYDWQINPGGVKSPRVMQAGRKAKLNIPGRIPGNDTAWSAQRKRNGGDNAPYSLGMVFLDAVAGNKESAEQFFRAISHMPEVKSKINLILQQNAVDAHANKYGSEWAEKTRHDYL